MSSFLTSIGYQLWILPLLLAIPVFGAAVIWIHGAMRDLPREDEVVSGAAQFPRMVALFTFAVEFVVSLGLWWSFNPANNAWQSVIDFPRCFFSSNERAMASAIRIWPPRYS